MNGRGNGWKNRPACRRISKTAALDDEAGRFPAEKIQRLRDAGYTALTVPEVFGGAGISVYDMVLFQERLARGDAAVALGIGWHLSVMGELGEGNSWDEDVFSFITEEVKNGAVLNRAATERQTGSPTREEDPAPPLSKRRKMGAERPKNLYNPFADFGLYACDGMD